MPTAICLPANDTGYSGKNEDLQARYLHGVSVGSSIRDGGLAMPTNANYEAMNTVIEALAPLSRVCRIGMSHSASWWVKGGAVN